jgi:membrane fusion protein (multidrug efflux system)
LRFEWLARREPAKELVNVTLPPNGYQMLKPRRFECLAVLTVLAAVALSGCNSRKPASRPAAPPEVAVVTMSPEPVLLTTELPGRTSAYLDAEVRPQVSGIIESREFEEGADVTAGEILYRIDSARYEALYEQAQAALAVAQARVPALRARAERSEKALAARALSQQDYDEAIAALKEGEATVELRAAEVESARIDLSYTHITAPISGRIGKSNVTVGALVTANQPAALATIRQFDPIYVDVTQSSADLLRLKHDWQTGALRTEGEAQRIVQLLLEDGAPYPLEGTLQFRDIAVDPTTGSYTLRVMFPNPQRLLLPGMFVRAIIQEGVGQQAILVPQQGVSRNAKGEPLALVVDDSHTVQQRKLSLDRALGERWLVSTGLAAGDRVIVEGLQKVRPGVTVREVPFQPDGQAAAQTGPAPQSQPSN